MSSSPLPAVTTWNPASAVLAWCPERLLCPLSPRTHCSIFRVTRMLTARTDREKLQSLITAGKSTMGGSCQLLADKASVYCCVATFSFSPVP